MASLIAIAGCWNAPDYERWEEGHLEECSSIIMLYKESFGEVPGSLDQLEAYDPSFKRIDLWDRPIRYNVTDDGYRLESEGPTKSETDDIVLEFDAQGTRRAEKLRQR